MKTYYFVYETDVLLELRDIYISNIHYLQSKLSKESGNGDFIFDTINFFEKDDNHSHH